MIIHSKIYFMKVLNNKLLLGIMLFVSVMGYVVSCTHKDVAVPDPVSNAIVITRGTAVLKAGSAKDNVKDSTYWKLDKVHSNAMWTTNYMGAAGLLTGRFNQFGIHEIVTGKNIRYVQATTSQPLLDTSWRFDEAHPENTYFSGYVQMNTSNTGELGRDTGCNISSLGTIKVLTGVHNLTDTNLAKIKTTKVEFDPLSADYIVTLDLSWKGMKTEVTTVKGITGRLKYIARGNAGTGVYPASYGVFGLQLSFQFNCRDFGITSTSIADKINIECNMNFNNK